MYEVSVDEGCCRHTRPDRPKVNIHISINVVSLVITSLCHLYCICGLKDTTAFLVLYVKLIYAVLLHKNNNNLYVNIGSKISVPFHFLVILLCSFLFLFQRSRKATQYATGRDL